MSRRVAREMALQNVFAMSFNGENAEETLKDYVRKEFLQSLEEESPEFKGELSKNQVEYLSQVVRGVEQHLEELDSYIEKYATGWEFGRVSRVAVCVMRIALYEILYMPEIPDGAAINEAVELSKRYDSPEAGAFVNGILGSFLRAERPGEEK